MLGVLSVVLLLLLSERAQSVGIIPTSDFWQSVRQSPIFQNLTSCQQSCISDVNSKTGCSGDGCCVSYGCVCSENTDGPNFINAENAVSQCSQSCPPNANSLSTVQAFDDLCVVFNAANLTTPSSTQAPVNGSSPTSTSTANFTLPGAGQPTGKLLLLLL
jgi:hypothetical protein